MSHTPGPWVCVYEPSAYKNERGAWAIRDCVTVVAYLEGAHFPQEESANARLIAAAPGMLAELERIAADETGANYVTNRGRAIALIAKVKG